MIGHHGSWRILRNSHTKKQPGNRSLHDLPVRTAPLVLSIRRQRAN
jgi:hypothetical protein